MPISKSMRANVSLHSHTKSELKEAKAEIAKLQEGKEALKLSEEANVDLKSVVDILQRRLFQTNSDASAYMHGSMELDERRLEEMGFEEVVGESKKLVDELNADTDNSPVDTGKQPPLLDSNKKDKPKDEAKPKRKRNVFPIKVLDSMGIDTSNLPPGFKLIHRKDKEYIHAALSLEKKLMVMLYGEGSRSHVIPEEQIFEHLPSRSSSRMAMLRSTTYP